MKSVLCDRFGIEFPLFAFSHCRDVVAAVTNAGGMGVLGAVGHTPESLEIELNWIDEHVGGKPYGVDLLVPNKLEGKDGSLTAADYEARVPPEHRKYVTDLLESHGIDTSDLWDTPVDANYGDNYRAAGAVPLMDVAFAHPIKLIVNALGVPPEYMLEQAHARGIAVGALTGAKEHAIKHAEAGVDILVVSGTEAGGHCGEISTMVVVPEVIQAMEAYPNVEVLAAGGIATGRQMAACMAMGAAGAWTGSVWLTTAEAETIPTVKQKMLEAGSRNTIRSRGRTGKPTRQLQSAWTDAWHVEGAPAPLPMPLQGLLSKPAMLKIDKLAESGHEGAKELATYFVGQAVGLMTAEQSARSVVYDFMEDYAAAVERLSATVAE
ncbi:MAG: nitronate monooxygenase [Alphaproteobacteria bacterium]|nr:nitronate monooxygenase [Alphaproteobacteria bacterium]MCB9931483.1 nitronate monooxygenase [Alphaproteobacteria bacterium]